MQADKREELRAKSYIAAVAVCEDLQHLRELVSGPLPSSDMVRRSSAILRRFLLDEVLPTVARPRIGQLSYLAMDNEPFYRHVERGGVLGFFVSGGVTIKGAYVRAIARADPDLEASFASFDPTKQLTLRHENFIAQRVMCLNRKWMTRKQVIRYMAHVGSGVHAGSVREDGEAEIEQLRGLVRLVEGPDKLILKVWTAMRDYTTDAWEEGLDCALVEMMGTARLICDSQSVIDLEAMIASENP